MTLAGRETSRLVAIFASIFLIQIAVVPHFRLSGYVVDLPLILVVLASLYLNPSNGALVGFLAGVSVDLVLHTPFGMTALTFSLVGYGTSSVSGQITGRHIFVRSLTVALISASATSLFAGIGALIGLEYVTRRELGSIAVVTAVAAVPSTVLLSPLVRWAFPAETVQIHE